MNIGKCPPNKNILVLIESTSHQYLNLLLIPTHSTTTTIPPNPLITVKNPGIQTQSKPKMYNSFELLQGSITEIQKKYEILSDIVIEYGGRVHGSQRDRY